MKQKQLLDCNIPIQGRRILLERLGPQHVDLLLESFANDVFWNVYRVNQQRTFSREQLVQQLQFEYERLPRQVGKIEWVISLRRERESERSYSIANPHLDAYLGLASISAIDSENNRGEFLIGFFNSQKIKPGLGLEAALLVLAFAFNSEKLANLLSFVYSSNPSAQKSTISLGFENEGLFNKHSNEAFGHLNGYRNEMPLSAFRNNRRIAKLSNYLLGFDITRPQITSSDKSQEHNPSFHLDAKFTIRK